jgi:hypothetical protein
MTDTDNSIASSRMNYVYVQIGALSLRILGIGGLLVVPWPHDMSRVLV